MGTVNLAGSRNYLKPVDIRIKTITTHLKYNSSYEYNDIALLELEHDVTFNNRTLRPACLGKNAQIGMNITAVISAKKNISVVWEFNINLNINLFRLVGAKIQLLAIL